MQGAGFVCVYVMDCLATQAIKVNHPHLLRPEIKTEEDVAADIVSNENEIILEKVEEEQMAMHSEDDDSDADGNGNNAILDLKFNKFDNKRNGNLFPGKGADASLADSESWRFVYALCNIILAFFWNICQDMSLYLNSLVMISFQQIRIGTRIATAKSSGENGST